MIPTVTHQAKPCRLRAGAKTSRITRNQTTDKCACATDVVRLRRCLGLLFEAFVGSLPGEAGVRAMVVVVVLPF